MSNTGCFCLFSYYCTNEEEGKNWVHEERLEDDVPTKCKNDDKHVIKESSVNILGKYIRVKQINQTDNFDECDMTKIDLLNIVQKCELLSQRVRVLEIILQRMNQIKFV